MSRSLTSPSRHRFIIRALKEAEGRQGCILEFGVGPGNSLKTILENTNRRVFGFDSFEGLPESWAMTDEKVFEPGSFKHKPPQNAPNLELVAGWFEHTIPQWKEQYSSSAAFIHIDSDLYSSCNTILTELNSRIIPGTVILFDEMFQYTNWEEGEYKAFNEWREKFHRETHEIGRDGAQAAYRVIV